MTVKYKKIFIIILIVWGLWFLGVGTLAGWLLSKTGLEKFPSLKPNDKLLILAPHIDDEVISSAGLIQQAKSVGAQVKVVYLTNGDDNLESVIKKYKNLKLEPNEFIALGEQRMREGEKATAILGLRKEDLIFLGYPDQGLYPMFGKFFSPGNPYTSPGTKLTYNPYSGTYESEQEYTGTNVMADLEEIMASFQPTFIIVPHPRDYHPDHRTTYLFLEKILNEKSNSVEVFTYLVHYRLFPSNKKLMPNQFLYPPKKLFTQKGWYSFDLTSGQEDKKLEAINQNASQREFQPLYDLLQSFVKKNEIFEKVD